MRKLLENFKTIASDFYYSTGLGVMCFDSSISILDGKPSSIINNVVLFYNLNRITKFLSDIFAAGPQSKKEFYTLTMDEHFICNIVILRRDQKPIGALVTQPFFARSKTHHEINKLVSKFNDHQNMIKDALLKVPIVEPEKIQPLGSLLNILALSLASDIDSYQVLCSNTDDSCLTNSSGSAPPARRADIIENALDKGSYDSYIQMKEAIYKGDANSLLKTINGFNPSTILMNQKTNYIRSLKNSLIKICSMCCYMAIEANAPFYKMMGLVNDTIEQLESAEEIHDIFQLAKKALISFTRAVALNITVPYSKPVRMVMDYIHENYAKKVSLDILAEHTGLSPTYLSRLIKKETGLSLNDNLNNIRIEQSKALLTSTNMNASEISMAVGYSYQNHFAVTFKKVTGLSPTKYKNMTKQTDKNGTDKLPDSVFSHIVAPLLSMMQQFPGLIDVARIVDPISYKSQIISPDMNVQNETCYKVWKTNKACPNCVSMQAYVSNNPSFKIEKQNDKYFMVFAIPKTVDKNLYVVEMIIDITQSVLIYQNMNQFNIQDLDFLNTAAQTNDENIQINNRAYIDKRLPFHVKLNQINKKSLSIILFNIEVCNGKDQDKENERPVDTDLSQKFVLNIAKIATPVKFWAGQYLNNVLLMVLDDADEVQTRSIVDLFYKRFDANQNYTVKYGIGSLSNEVKDADSLITKAFTDLYMKSV